MLPKRMTKVSMSKATPCSVASILYWAVKETPWNLSVQRKTHQSILSFFLLDELDEEEKLLYDIIKDKQAIARKKNHETKTTVPKKFTIRGRSESSIREQLETVGLESDGVINSTMGGKKRNR